MPIEQVTEAFAKIAEDFKVKPMQGASMENDLSTGFTRFIHLWSIVFEMAAKVEK